MTPVAIPAMLVERCRCNQKRSSTSRFRIATMYLQRENLVRRAREHPREAQRERKAWHVPIALDRIDALPRHADRLGQLLLRPAAPQAQILYAVLNPGKHDKLTGNNILDGEHLLIYTRIYGHERA